MKKAFILPVLLPELTGQIMSAASEDGWVIKPFRTNRILQGLILWLIVLWITTAINPLYPRDWLLENLLVFFYGALLLIIYRWFKFSNLSYAFFTTGDLAKCQDQRSRRRSMC